MTPSPSPKARELMEMLKNIPLDLPCSRQDFIDYERRKLVAIQSALDAAHNEAVDAAASLLDPQMLGESLAEHWQEKIRELKRSQHTCPVRTEETK